MAGISASLIGTAVPKLVQVVVTGLTVGDEYVVTGHWSGGLWPVRAGTGVAAASQVVLSDNQTPVNVPITYKVSVNGGLPTESAPVTVNYAGQYVLQSLDGTRSAAFLGASNGMPRESALRTSTFRVPGRSTPAVRYDIAAGESGAWEIHTLPEETEPLRLLIHEGAPLLLRTDGAVRDMAAVEFVVVTSATRRLVGVSSERIWSVGFTVIDDPQPNAVVITSTWDDFDVAYAVADVVERTNASVNPSFEVDAATARAEANCSLARSTAQAAVGAASLAVTATAAGDVSVSLLRGAGEYPAVVEGETWTAQQRFRADATGRNVRVEIYWTDSAGAVVGTETVGAEVADATTGWTTATVTGTAPSGAVQLFVNFRVFGCAASEVHYVDAVLVEKSSTVNAYFDGDTTDTATERYDWTGTAHASTSTKTKVSNTWDVFDAEWTGDTWDLFDLEDWATRADGA